MFCDKYATKEDIIELLNKNGIQFCETSCCGCENICITFNHDPENQKCINSAITVLTTNKAVYRIYPNDILYIAIENRKSVIYTTDRKIETAYSISFWKNILDDKVFVQPHYSYIINLNYVDSINKNLVIIKNGNNEYKVYASTRKLPGFKKSLLKLKNTDMTTD